MAAGKSRFVDRLILIVEAVVGIAVVGAIIGSTYGFSSTLVFIFCGIATAFSGYVLVKMFLSLSDETLEVTGRIEDEERAALEHEKLLLLQGIKELEADAGVGKVDAADYRHLRETAETRALQIIHKLKESDQRWRAEAEALLEKRLGRPVGPAREVAAAPLLEDPEHYKQQSLAQRKARAAYSKLFDDRPVEMRAGALGGVVCNGCETENQEVARYCIGCGRPRKDARAESFEVAEGTP